MQNNRPPHESVRYVNTSKEKSYGVTYTPKLLADFVAGQIVRSLEVIPNHLRLLDPAIGDGELVLSLLKQLYKNPKIRIEVHGFETDSEALDTASRRIRETFPDVTIHMKTEDFLSFIVESCCQREQLEFFRSPESMTYDLVIANPPYVRTQILGATQSRRLANQFGLSGRVDLYHAFLLAMASVLAPYGAAGIIVSNRFMTTKSGSRVREAILDRFSVQHVWDLGDTKLFHASVLPAVLVLGGKNLHSSSSPCFSSIYESTAPATQYVSDPIAALALDGLVRIDDGRRFHVQHGRLDSGDGEGGLWRMASPLVEGWLSTVESHSWGTFGDIGKVRVGVKTCADRVFIRDDWNKLTDTDRPELLRPVITHRVARRFKARVSDISSEILYPHEYADGIRRAVDLRLYPSSSAYLEAHRRELERRHYVAASGRYWYEIWVPQNPAIWNKPKLIFRDIVEEPTFWIDLTGAVVNGDCYWMVCDHPSQIDLLWLAVCVGNSSFIERFYDYRFHNKLYARRRRFMTQYVEQFPIPDPDAPLSREIVKISKTLYHSIDTSDVTGMQRELNALVWKSFGLAEEAVR